MAAAASVMPEAEYRERSGARPTRLVYVVRERRFYSYSQGVRMYWDPATQLRLKRKGVVPPRPDGAPNRGLELVQVEPGGGR